MSNKTLKETVSFEHSLLTEDFKNWDRLLGRENRIVEQSLLPKGHLDPREHEHHRESVDTGEDRMFIKGYKLVPYSQLINSNVRDCEVDEKYVKEELRYLMDEYAAQFPDSCGLKYPIIGIEDIITGDITIQSGHHRAFGCDVRETLVPVILLTKPINKFGKKTDPNAKNYAKARCNPAPESIKMKCVDAVLHLDKLFQTDPTLNGRNPTGTKPPRKTEDGSFDFVQFCDLAFGKSGNFKSPQAKGRLYNQWTKQGHKSKTCQTSNEDNITLFLSRNGLSTGIDKNTGKRKDVVNHSDGENGALIVQTDDNGDNFGGKLWRILRECERNPHYAEALEKMGIDKVIVAGRLYNTPNTLTDVKARRKNFYQICTDYSKILSKCTPLYIEKVVMPKELRLVSDKDETYVIPVPLKTILRKAQ